MRARSRSASTPKFQIDYHSFAQLILYPEGWQVETPATDAPLMTALAGDDDHPAVAGFDPDVSARALHDQRRHHRRRATHFGTLAYTVELAGGAGPGRRRHRRRTGLASRPAASSSRTTRRRSRRSSRRTCRSRSTWRARPSNPAEPGLAPRQHGAGLRADDVRDVLRRPADRRGERQALARRRRRRTGRSTAAASSAPRPREFEGGERYGEPGVYYHRLRARITRHAAPATSVEVWFTGRRQARRTPFTFTVASDDRHRVLLMAAEDYTGQQLATSSPSRTPGRCTCDDYTTALDDAGIGYDVYDVDAHGRTAPDRARRALALQRGRLVHGRGPLRARAGAARRHRHVEAVRRRDPRGARLPQRGRQAARHRQAGARRARGTSSSTTRSGAPPNPYCAANQTSGDG